MFSAPKKNADGKYFAKTSEKTFVQIDNIRLLTNSEDTMTIGFTTLESVTKIFDMNAKIIQAAKENSEAWFGRVVPDKTIEAGFTDVVAKGDDHGVMNVTRAKGSKVFMNKKVVESDIDTEGSMCDVVLELCGVSFGKKTYSPVWQLVQTRIRVPKKKAYDEYLFQGGDESDSE
jgi:hypothetical protein